MDLTPIEHIFIVMMENRSFDHVLGHLDLPPDNRTDVAGINRAKAAHYRLRQNGGWYEPQPRTSPVVAIDPLHEREDIQRQMEWQQGDPMMTGFVEDYSTVNPGEPTAVGQYYTGQQVPITHFLAQQFCVCDHWFACLPASTQPNRLMAMSGYAMRDHTLNTLLDNQDMLYDWLDVHGVSWRVYSEDIPFMALMPKVMRRIVSDIWSNHFRGFQMLEHDVDSSDFPSVTFIEPAYTDGPDPEKGDDDHPTTSVARGQEFLRRIYHAVTQNLPLWEKSLLIITYDEHGGFFDHVRPPALVTTHHHSENYPLFTTLGVRVPALLVSPFVQAGKAYNGTLDHTSILKLFAEKFGRSGEQYSPDVAARAGIQSVSDALTDTPSALKKPPPAPELPAASLQSASMLATKPAAMLAPNQLAFRNAMEGMRQTNRSDAARKFPQWNSFFLRGTK